MIQAFLIGSGNFFFRFRNFLFPVFIILLLFFARPAFFWGDPGLDRIGVALGFLIALLGQAFRFLVIGFAYIKRGGKEGRVYADELVTEGLYAHVRNPMYIGNFLILMGLGIMYGSLWVYVLVIPFFSYVFLSIVVTEENSLKRRFSAAYDDYCRSVNRFIPDLRGLRKSLQKFTYDWRKALRKDYGTFFGVLLGSFATFLVNNCHFTDFPRTPGQMFIFALGLVCIGTGYGLARYLKKSGRLA